MALSDRIVVMNAGRIAQIGTPDAIYRCPGSRFVADFIGRANFAEATVERSSGGEAAIALFGRPLSVPITFPAAAGQRVTVMLRPEALVLRADSTLPQATVEQAMYLGSETEYWIRLDDQRLVVVDRDPRSRVIVEGERVGVAVLPEALHVLPT
jgi:iron(III) transport system ATP-binding protein